MNDKAHQPKKLTLDLAARIKVLRRERGWTRRELGRQLNATAHYIAALESCDASPTVLMLENLAAVFGVTLRVELG